MIKTGQLLFLGTGASMGTPVIGCSCDVCQSTDPLNKRFRSSIFCAIGDKRILVDCGPDFKQQALQNKIDRLDGLIITHAHNDHTAGIDDLRVFPMRTGTPIPCLLSCDTAKDLKMRFNYLFEDNVYADSPARFRTQEFEGEKGEVVFQGIRMGHFSYRQLGMRVDGLRFGNLAYVSDIKDYTDAIFEHLKGIETLVVSALRFEPTKMHFSVDEAIAFSNKSGAHKTWLMHVSHDMGHAKGNAYLPDNIEIAYDGLQLQFEVETVSDLRA